MSPVPVLIQGWSLDMPAGNRDEVVGSLLILKGNTGLRCECLLGDWFDPRGPGPDVGAQHPGFLPQDCDLGHPGFSPAAGPKLERQASGSHCVRKASRCYSPPSASGPRWTGGHP